MWISGIVAFFGGNTNTEVDTPEVINLNKVSSPCTNTLEKLDYNEDRGAAYGLLEEKYPIFCGGKSKSLESVIPPRDTCQVLGHSHIKYIEMDQGRDFAGGLMLDSNILWVAGGQDKDGNMMKSTIFVTLNGFESGPDLPYPNSDFCFLKHEKFVYMIGGNYDRRQTQVYNYETGNWSQASDIIHLNLNTVDAIQCLLFEHFGEMVIGLWQYPLVQYFVLRNQTWLYDYESDPNPVFSTGLALFNDWKHPSSIYAVNPNTRFVFNIKGV